MDQDRATGVLNRFAAEIRSTARQVAETFGYPVEVADVEQEASILVMSYDGLVPDGRLSGKLRQWETLASGDRSQIRRLLSSQLRLDLSQIFGRESDKRAPEYSLDSVPEAHLPALSFEDYVTEETDLRGYPYLYAKYIEGLTEREIAVKTETSYSTVKRRITREKRIFLARCITDGGLKVEGDETLTELQESYTHLKA